MIVFFYGTEKRNESDSGLFKPRVIYILEGPGLLFEPAWPLTLRIWMNEWIAVTRAENYFYRNECYTDVISYPS